jgi:hypothetical protein
MTPRTFRARSRDRACDRFDYFWETTFGEASEALLKGKSTGAKEMSSFLDRPTPGLLSATPSLTRSWKGCPC